MKMAQGTDLVICEVSSDRISLSYHASLAILKVFARVSQQSLDVLVPCFESILGKFQLTKFHQNIDAH